MTVIDANAQQKIVYNLLTHKTASYEDYVNVIKKNFSPYLAKRTWHKGWVFIGNNSNVRLKKPVQALFDQMNYIPNDDGTMVTFQKEAFDERVKNGNIKMVTKLDSVGFLRKPKILYADSTLALIKHRSDADPQSYTLRCLKADGQVLWKKQPTAIAASKTLSELVAGTVSQLTTYHTRHKNTLAISCRLPNNSKGAAAVLGLNILTGEVLWEHIINY